MVGIPFHVWLGMSRLGQDKMPYHRISLFMEINHGCTKELTNLITYVRRTRFSQWIAEGRKSEVLEMLHWKEMCLTLYHLNIWKLGKYLRIETGNSPTEVNEKEKTVGIIVFLTREAHNNSANTLLCTCLCLSRLCNPWGIGWTLSLVSI